MKVTVRYRAITALPDEEFAASSAEVLPDGSLRISEPLGSTTIASGVWLTCIQERS
jgi:hypothetical protein